MAINLSAEKRHRQSEKRRLRNRVFKTKTRNLAKKLTSAIESDSKEEALEHYRQLMSMLDKGVSKGVFHKNTASRKKSRMNSWLAKMQ